VVESVLNRRVYVQSVVLDYLVVRTVRGTERTSWEREEGGRRGVKNRPFVTHTHCSVQLGSNNVLYCTSIDGSSNVVVCGSTYNWGALVLSLYVLDVLMLNILTKKA